MRKILSLLLIGTLILGLFSLNVLAEESQDSISELSKYNIMNGDPDGNMRLNDNLTRAEAVTLLVRLYGFEPETSDAAPANKFSDMGDHWACNAVMIAQGLRIIEESDSESFRPDEKILSEEFLKMIICLLGYDEVAEKKGGEPIGYLMQASQLGVTEGAALVAGEAISREKAAALLSNSLDVPLMVMTSFSMGGNNEYAIMNGKNGMEYRTLRTMIEKK